MCKQLLSPNLAKRRKFQSTGHTTSEVTKARHVHGSARGRLGFFCGMLKCLTSVLKCFNKFSRGSGVSTTCKLCANNPL